MTRSAHAHTPSATPETPHDRLYAPGDALAALATLATLAAVWVAAREYLDQTAAPMPPALPPVWSATGSIEPWGDAPRIVQIGGGDQFGFGAPGPGAYQQPDPDPQPRRRAPEAAPDRRSHMRRLNRLSQLARKKK